MSKISCPIIRDILPLYVDDVVSDDTRHMVEEHLAHCDDCRKLAAEMQGEMVLPIENDTKPLEHFKNAWKRKKVMIAVISVVVTLLASLLIGTAIYIENMPAKMVMLQDANTSGEWERVEVDESGYLNFDSLFCSKEVVLDANSEGPVFLRISDEQGNVVIDDLMISPGFGVSLDALERNTNYIVEMKTYANTVFLRFI